MQASFLAYLASFEESVRSRNHCPAAHGSVWFLGDYTLQGVFAITAQIGYDNIAGYNEKQKRVIPSSLQHSNSSFTAFKRHKLKQGPDLIYLPRKWELLNRGLLGLRK